MATGGWANASYKAVSGKPDKHRKFVYSVERQKTGGGLALSRLGSTGSTPLKFGKIIGLKA